MTCPFVPVFQNLVYMYGDMLSNVGAAEKVFCYIDRKPNLPQPGTLAPTRLEGRVEFQDISFSYPSRPEKPVLKVPAGDPVVRDCGLYIIFSRKLPSPLRCFSRA